MQVTYVKVVREELCTLLHFHFNIMANELIEKAQRLIVNTGNILSLNDITKKPGQNPTEELTEAVNITLKDFENLEGVQSEADQPVVVTRRHDDLITKMSEHELADLKIGLKIFLNSDSEGFIIDALDKAFSALNVSSVHNVIVSYNQKGGENGVTRLQNIWKVLENYTENKKINQIGLSDVEEGIFRAIYEWATIKPSIIQINLATCCVVPPTLQAFCKEHEVQLLTHSDPTEILSEGAIKSIFGRNLSLNWVLRFLVHIKCRGVLTTKGYLVSLDQN